MECAKCNLALPPHLMFKCDGHCEQVLCKTHLLEHAKDVRMTHRTIPKLMGKMK